MTRSRPFTLIASLIFAIMALLHIYRLFTHFQVILGSHEIPDDGQLCRDRRRRDPGLGLLPGKQKLGFAQVGAAALHGPGGALAERSARRADLVEHHEVGAPFVAGHVARR